ncbi:MAG: ArsR/SmtB family transcription factor [Rhodospirillaceae bacterium]
MNQALTDLQVFKAEFFRALAHPVRIRLLEELANGSKTVHALQESLGLDQPTVSQQLAVLRAKNLVVATKSGTSVHYAARDPLIHDLLMTARAIFNNHLVDTQAMLSALARERRRKS